VTVSTDGLVMVVDGDRLERSEPGVYVGMRNVVIDGIPLVMQTTVRVTAADRMILEGLASYAGCTITERSVLTR
jgi:hypothetical protein